MPEIDQRLTRCFASVFPSLTAEQIPTASVESIPAWDSLAAVTLIAVLEQEFDVQIDLADFPKLTSYTLIYNHIIAMSKVKSGG
jgi:acyl carrier protein